MKVCDIAQWYAPQSGGIKRYIQAKSLWLGGATDHCHVIVIPGDCYRLTTLGRCTTHLVKSPRVPGSGGYRFFLRLGAIRRIVEKEQPDIIEAADPYASLWAARAAARRLNIPVVCYQHSGFVPLRYLPGHSEVHNALRRCNEAFERWHLRRTDAVFVASDTLRAQLTSNSVPRVCTVPIGCDPAAFDPALARGRSLRAELGLPDDAILLLYVGRFAAEKRLHLLLDMMRHLRSRGGRRLWHLVLAGDGPCRAALLRDAIAMPTVSFEPYTTDTSRLATLYASADAFVHPGHGETFGLAALEARFCGCPTVCVRGSGLSAELMDNAGEVAGSPTGESLAEAVVRAVDRKFDRAALRSAALARFSADACFKHQLKLYSELIDIHRSEARAATAAAYPAEHSA